MKITEAAKENLNLLFKRLNKDVLSFAFIKRGHCCHDGELSMAILSGVPYEVVDGIKVHINDDIKDNFDDVVIDYKDEQYSLTGYRHCHHNHGDENCDCGGECDGDCDREGHDGSHKCHNK